MTQEEKNFEIINLNYGKASTHTFFKPEKCLYTYNGSKKSGTVYYCCIEEHCACRGKIILDVFSRTNPEVDHNHENHEKKAEYERSYYQLKEIVSNERRAVRDIHQEFLRTMSFETSGHLAWGHVRHTLLRIRRQKMPACPDLQTFINHLESNDDIYESYGMIRDLPFYLGTVKNTMMIFGNQRMVAELEPNCSLFIDATYGITPFNAHQLLVVLAEIKGKPRPIAYAVMTSRREADYVAVFEHLRNSLFSYDGNIRVPVNAMCDYEKAMRNALPKVWPDINVRGCFFHFTQAIRRKAMKFQELSTKLNGDTIHHNTLLMFSRLCLLPIDRIDIGLEALVEYISSNRILERDFRNFIDYFDRTWMIRYDKSDWCISDSVRRSNNHVEGHNRFIKQIIDRNPPAWIFIEGLLDVSYDALATLAADEGNNSQIDRSRISNPLARFLAELEEDNITELEFLQQLARITHSSYPQAYKEYKDALEAASRIRSSQNLPKKLNISASVTAVNPVNLPANTSAQQLSQFDYRTMRSDASLIAPIRQTASIFKQPVTVIKSQESKVKSELKHGTQDKPRQLFWEKRLEAMNACDSDGAEFAAIDLPKQLKTVGPNIKEQTLFQSVATALHTSLHPVTGQTSPKNVLTTNPGVFVNPDQPLLHACSITDEDIRKQEERVNGIRKKLQEALAK